MAAPVRFSNLKNMALSPAHYKYRLDNPGSFDTPAMRLGRLVHVLTLTPTIVPTVYDGVRRGEEWKEFQKAHAGEELYSIGEYDLAEAMAEAVHADPVAREAMADEAARVEEQIYWTSPAGRECQARPDWFTAGRVLDLKSTTDAHPERFPRQSSRLAYHAQLAWYMDGVTDAGLGSPDSAVIVAVESKAPHVVTVFEMAPSLIDAGRKQYRLWFEELMVCEASGQWPGYSQCPVVLEATDDLSLRIGDEEMVLA